MLNRRKLYLYFNKKEIIVFLGLFVIILIPNFFFIILGVTLEDSFYKKAGYLFISIIINLFPFLFLKRKTALLILGTFLIVAPFEIWSVLYNGLPLNAGHVTLFLQTNKNEAFEFLGSYKSIVWAFVVIIVLYFFIVLKYSKNLYLFNLKSGIIFIVIFISTFTSLYLYGYMLGSNITSNKSERNAFANVVFNKKFSKIYPLNIYVALNDGFIIQKELTAFSEDVNDFKFNAHKKTNDNSKEIYILVIGETARYLNFGINGYYRNTTPNLSKINNLLSFSNIYSEANTTQISLPILLTRATATEFHIQKEERSVVEAFKECNFHTCWIANQSFNYPFVQRILKNTDEVYISTNDIESPENYDEKLLEPLKKVLNSNINKLFIVIHSLGSHFRYNFRYPQEYEIYKPSFKGSFDYGLINLKNKELLINSYDNSILYTDFFLSEIIKLLKNISDAKSVMLYTSDHGENLYDYERLVLHGSTNPSKFEAHVPLFIWYSDEYGEKHPQKIKELYKNQNKKISSSVIFHSLLDMADIKIDNEQPKKSIASSELANDSVRFMLNPVMEIVAEEDLLPPTPSLSDS